MDARSVDASEIVSHAERRVGRHRDVIVHGVRGATARREPSPFFIRVHRADAHTLTGLFHLNLDLVREILRFGMGARLHADSDIDFYVAPRFTVHVNPTKAMLD